MGEGASSFRVGRLAEICGDLPKSIYEKLELGEPEPARAESGETESREAASGDADSEEPQAEVTDIDRARELQSKKSSPGEPT